MMSEAAPVARTPAPRSREEIEDLVPLAAPWFYAPWALAEDGPLHGYAIMRKVQDKSASRIKMGTTGSTYRSLFAMVELGLIERMQPPERADPRRRYYRITCDGAKTFEAQVRFMEEELRWAREALAKEVAEDRE